MGITATRQSLVHDFVMTATLVPAESVIVVLSKQGRARAAKGHEVGPEKLNYKAGDGSQKVDSVDVEAGRLDAGSPRRLRLLAMTIPSDYSEPQIR